MLICKQGTQDSVIDVKKKGKGKRGEDLQGKEGGCVSESRSGG